MGGGATACVLLGDAPDDSPTPVDESATPVADAYADRVTRFEPGEGAGFGQDLFPNIVLGPPVGGGQYQGSIDVLSLGAGGMIELAFDRLEVVDGPGIDLLVFENPFEISGGNTYAEPARVSVSPDGIVWTAFPCELVAPEYLGCAGVMPVYANPTAGISATDPAVAGGDGFDLASVGLSSARFIRLEDQRIGTPAAPATGFDLDSVAIVHAGPVQSE